MGLEADQLANATLSEMESFAAAVLPSYALDYYASGARDEQTFRGNLAAWERWWLVPRMLIDVSTVSLATSMAPTRMSLPWSSPSRLIGTLELRHSTDTC